MLNNFKITARLSLGFILIYVLMAILTIFAITNMKAVEGKLERIVKVNNLRQQFANQMADIVREDAIAVRNVFLQKNRVNEMKDRMDKNNLRYEEAFRIVQESTTKSETEETKVIARVRTARDIQKRLDDRTMELAIARKFDEGFNLYIEEARASMRESIEAIDALIRNQQIHNNLRYAEAVKTYHDARIYMLSMGCFAIVLGVVIGTFLSRSIIRPLSKGVAVVNRLANGDLTAHNATTSRDEIGQLLAATNRMAANLRDIVKGATNSSYHVAASAEKVVDGSTGIKKSAQDEADAVDVTMSSVEQMAASVSMVARHTGDLAANVAETSATIDEMAASIEQVGKSAEAMAASVDQTTATIGQMLASLDATARNSASMTEAVGETSLTVENLLTSVEQIGRNTESLKAMVTETSSTIEEMTRTVKEVSGRIEGANRLSQTAYIDAEEGGKAIFRSIESLHNMGKSTERIMDIIQNLGKRSEEIGSIVEVIDDIADQTNLLALNAAIEAARAGDTGRGFAVVADEIRKLAERSMAATKEIAGVIRVVQGDTDSAIKVTEETYREGKGNITLAENSRDAFTSIIASMKDSSDVMHGVARSTSEINTAIEHVMKFVIDMNASTEEVASGVRSQMSETGSIRNSLDNMNKLVKEVTAATTEQSLGGNQIRQAVDRVRDIVREVGIAVKEQVGGTRQIVQSVEVMHSMTQGVASATADQKSGGETIVNAMEGISRISSVNLDLSKGMVEVAKDTLFQIENLQYSLSGFRINADSDRRCWELMNCPVASREKCPAHNSEEERCWLITGTWCKGVQQGDARAKLRNCMTCNAFRTIQGLTV